MNFVAKSGKSWRKMTELGGHFSASLGTYVPPL
ncbi:MAG: hypothetical protein ACJAUE_002477 [Alcanivorax sp.]|jgi:hypothetical protein